MDNKSERAQKEEQILQFWKDNKIFEKTLEKKAPKGEFVFYEGPPTANGRPGIHHIEARSFKDAIPRYKTMRGFRVLRKGGWDTHGLPVELEVEKQLGLKSKKEIENYGIAKFNEECRKSVWKYVDEWQKFTDRVGYWVDLNNAYVTYHNEYIEALWSVLAHIEKRKLLYKDYKVLPWCPRCGTALSSHELAQGYQDVKDISVYAKFKIKDFDKAYFLAWTTTPWTLPGNVALAVGEDVEYVEAKVGEEIFVLAKNRLSIISEPYEILATHKGKEMVGMTYEPLYEFGPKNEKSHKIYTADFVTTEDGTGIVHTAVMYGQDDFVLGTKIGLPKQHTVDETGHFKSETGFLSGRFVKDEETAVEIIKDLAYRNLLFKKEKYEHPYPHCWRCKTPLIYYARDSWYIAMSKLRDELVKENEKINWEPEHIKEGRFGEWLREVKDWAISRERYWGTPLPVWQNKDGTKRIVVDSIETLKKFSKNNGNQFIFARHGEAEHNTLGICNSDPTKEFHLTEKGREESKKISKKVKKADIIYTSPFMRTRETAEIVANAMGIDKEQIRVDKRLVDLNFGEFDGQPFASYLAYEAEHMKTYGDKLPGGESYADAKRRFGDFLYEIDAQNHGKRILVVTHGIGLETSTAFIEGADGKRSKEIIDVYTPKPGDTLEFNFVPLPKNANHELDLHRPYIDEVVLEKDGEEYRRVKEVMDVWFDSGAMPFAQDPKNVQFPADYISEAIDQTRGWFYTLHAVGVLMEKGRAFKNVICLGHILDKDGKKMSKSIGNVVDPWLMTDKYGVDTLRLWMYSVNQPGDSKNFDEKTVDELQKKVFNRLENVLTFYELYKDKISPKKEKSFLGFTYSSEKMHLLDTWIEERQKKLIIDVTDALDDYHFQPAARAIIDFVDDLSTWYLRRSRTRLEALPHLRSTLKIFATILAPFAPFTAENIYQRTKDDDDKESVHLETWPETSRHGVNTNLLETMESARKIVSMALEMRMKANIKVRQPLMALEVKKALPVEYLEIVGDELNVKVVAVNPTLEGEVALDMKLTSELVEEGKVRDAIRAIQDWRKEKNLKPGESVRYDVPEVEREFFAKHAELIKKATNVEF